MIESIVSSEPLRAFHGRIEEVRGERKRALLSQFPPWYVCEEGVRSIGAKILFVMLPPLAMFLFAQAFVAGTAGVLTSFVGCFGIGVGAASLRSRRLDVRTDWLKGNSLHPYRSEAVRTRAKERLLDRFVVQRAVLDELADRLSPPEIEGLKALLPPSCAVYEADEDAWQPNIATFSHRYVQLVSRIP